MHALLSFFTGIIFLVSLVPAQAQEHSWKQLYDSATWYYAEQNYAQALTNAEKALGKSNIEDTSYAANLQLLRLVHNRLGQYQLAVDYNVKECEARAELQGETHPMYLHSLNDLAGNFLLNGQYSEAEKHCQDALSRCEEIYGKASSMYGTFLVDAGAMYQALDRYEEAERAYVEALPIVLNTLGEKNLPYAKNLAGLAGICEQKSSFDRSENYYRQALRVLKEIEGDNGWNYLNYLANMALMYDYAGKYAKAELLYEELRRGLLRTYGNQHISYAEFLSNFASLQILIGQYAKAEESLLEARKIIVNTVGKEHPYYFTIINNTASVYNKMQRHEEATILYEKVLEGHKRNYGDSSLRYANALHNLGATYFYQKQYDVAEVYYHKALKICRTVTGEHHSLYTAYMKSLAGVYALQNKYQQAEEAWNNVLETRKQLLGESHPSTNEVNFNLARLYVATHQYHKAENLMMLGINQLHEYIDKVFPVMSEREKYRFFKIPAYNFESFNTFVSMRMRENPELIGQMYDNQLTTKAILLKATRNMNERIANSRDSSLADLYSQWQKIRNLIATTYQTSKAKNSLDSLEKQANQMERELSHRSNLFASIADAKQYFWQDIRSKLKPGEAAVEMIRFRQYDFSGIGSFTDSVFYAALIITPETEDHPQLVLMKNGNAIENEYLRAYRYDITNQTHEFDTYQWFWEPIANTLPNVRTIYFSPDGAYHQLNLTTLFNKQTRKYLLEEMEIRVLATTKELLDKSVETPQDKSMALFGFPDYDLSVEERRHQRDSLEEPQETFVLNLERGNNDFTPLPGTRTEVENIEHLSKHTGWQTNVFLGKSATEEQVKKVSNPTVLHIATHGYFLADLSPDDPAVENPLLRSGLLMAGAKISLSDTINRDPLSETILEDGILTAYEVMNLNLFNTELVVLSACETGVGEVKNGEGVYSLQRAFSAAGAESVLMSLWKVNDAVTQEMMRRFYEKWLGGMEKHEALRKAQLQIKKRFPHPYYWGAFVMSGK